MLVYTMGRKHLLNLFHSELQSDLIRVVGGPNIRHAYEQPGALEASCARMARLYGLSDSRMISERLLRHAACHHHLEGWVEAPTLRDR